ncbi:dipeptidase [Streptomyces sp. T-3]|nr:dipeptidase [Streptomyces sp. T-3]
MADLQDESHAPGEVGTLDPPAVPVEVDPALDAQCAAELEAAAPAPVEPPTPLGPGATPMERVRALLATHPVADGHSGLPWALSQLAWYDLELGESALRTDIPRLRAGSVGAMFWSLRVPDDYTGDRAVSATLELIDLTEGVVRGHPDALRMARSASEAADSRAHGRIACLLGPANATALGDSLGALRALHTLGVRSIALLGTRWASGTGLSRFGEEVVREMNRLGVLADLSHSSEATIQRTLAVSKAPVLFSRSGARALTDHPDNLTDDLLGALRANRGLCMVPLSAAQTGPTLRHAADHLDHVREIAGVECVGLSGTYDTDESTHAPELEDTARYPHLLAELLERGWTEAEVALLTWGNVQRVLRDTDFTARAAQLRRPPSSATIDRLDV